LKKNALSGICSFISLVALPVCIYSWEASPPLTCIDKIWTLFLTVLQAYYTRSRGCNLEVHLMSGN
jgi:hypothetical protein